MTIQSLSQTGMFIDIVYFNYFNSSHQLQNRYTHLDDGENCDDDSDDEDMDNRPCFPANSILLARQNRELEDVERRFTPPTPSSILQRALIPTNK